MAKGLGSHCSFCQKHIIIFSNLYIFHLFLLDSDITSPPLCVSSESARRARKHIFILRWNCRLMAVAGCCRRRCGSFAKSSENDQQPVLVFFGVYRETHTLSSAKWWNLFILCHLNASEELNSNMLFLMVRKCVSRLKLWICLRVLEIELLMVELTSSEPIQVSSSSELLVI